MEKGIFNTIFVLLIALAVNAQTPVAEFSASVQSGCSPLSVAFRDQSTGDPKYWNWDFGNGQLSNLQNPTATFSAPGTYTVTLVVRNQNGVNAITKTDYITVYPSPSVSLSANITTACIPTSIQFTGTATTADGTISGYAWDFGDGTTSTEQNPSHVYQQTGYYSVSLTATSSNGCVGRTGRGRYIRMVGGIEAEFLNTPSPECRPPFNVAFTNESSGPGTLTYEWDFGNGNTSTDPNPVASFSSSGNYNVLLTTRSSFGCVDTISKTVAVNTFTTDFSNPDTVCIGQQVSFQNTSAPGVVSFGWNFGDGTGSTQVSPVKTYSTPGNYSVKLVNNFSSCSDSLEKTIVVTGKPPVDFTSPDNSGCQAPLNVNFQANAPGAVSWQWDFGDGSQGTGATPQHTYTAKGEYNVTLTITTSGGCESSVTKNQFVRIIAPTVSITNSNASGCAPLTNVTPTANVNAIDGVASYAWDFGNGNTSSSATPSTSYTTPGNYTITLTITTNGGCTATATSTVRAGTPPSNVDFTASTTGDCISDIVSFQGTATNANEWSWDFGDGESSNLQNPQHTYTDTGWFDVRLIALNNGCPAPAVTKNNIVFKQAPVANFGFNLDCINRRSVTFSDSSITDPTLSGLTYDWSFGDGNSSNTASPGTYTYAQYGTYTVRLTVTNGSCSGMVEKPIDVRPLDSTFTVSKNPLCRDERVSLTALEDPSNIRDFAWYLNGQPLFIGTQTLDTSFPSLGNSIIRLRVRDIYGCEVNSTQTISVTGPNALFTASSLAVCKDGTVTFTDQSTADVGIASWAWDFGDGQAQSFNNPPFTHAYTDTGSFVVKLRVTDNAGCTHEYISVDTIRVTNPVAAFGTGNQLFCPGLELPFRDSSTGHNLTYDWNFGDGQTGTDQHPLHTFTSEGSYTVKLIITDAAGCRDSVTRPDYVSIRQPVAAFTVEDSTSICQLLETRFYHSSQNYESLLWDFGDGTDSRLDQPVVRHFYDDFGSYTAKLYARGYGGCVDSATFPINVYNPATYTQINYTVPAYACNELTVHFDFTVPPNTKYYFYFGDGSIDSSGQKTLQHTYNYPNVYRPSVYMIDSGDCRTQITGSPAIDIRGPVPAFNLDRRAFCDSGTVFATNFTISRNGDPVVSQSWDFGDGTTYTEKDPPPHAFTQPGLYPVTLSATTATGCSLSFSDTVRVPRTPQPLINADDLTCINRTVSFDGTLVYPPDTAIVWSWNFGDGRTSAEQNNTIVYERPGEYTIALTAANFLNCRGTTQHPFTVAPLPVITTAPATMPVGGQVQLPVTYSSGIATYSWTPAEGLSCTDCPNPVARPQFDQTYTVTVTDSNTCMSSAEITVRVLCTEENYFVPNTFSPNGDGMNDVFYPRGRGLARVQTMRIYNRWGQQVFERKNFMANDASKGWNGRLGTQNLPPDVYVYIVEFVCDNAQIVPMKGNVTLIR
ncbi:MAG: PKD domain-containing protein [Chitinophagaceae bacterium]|nr:PKD domain-containing protein [Chitinophagaceae bacterium]